MDKPGCGRYNRPSSAGASPEARLTMYSEREGAVLSDIVIREARPVDAEALAVIATEAWRPIYEFRRQILGDELYELAFPNALEHKAAGARRVCDPERSAGVRVVEKDGRVAGFITFFIDVKPGIAEIGNNAVHPDFQGQGIGRRMYAHVFEEMKKKGQRYVKVATGGEGDPSHAPARRAYEKAGFKLKLPSVTYFREL